ncbi:MAG: hypothetical protein JWO12_2572 [Frankiales bacterium]|nr:hypothetical protein [Frankiales bacterium]
MTDPFAPPSGEPQPPTQPPVYGTPSPPPPYGAPQDYAPPQYGAPQYGGPVSGPPRNGFGVAALVLGILALVLCFTIFGGIVLGILALVFGVLGRRRAKNGEATNGGMALAGAICGGLGMLASIGILVFALTNDSTRNYLDCLSAAGQDKAAQTACQVEYQQQLTN